MKGALMRKSILTLNSGRTTIPLLASTLHHSPITRFDADSIRCIRWYSSDDESKSGKSSKDRLNNLLKSIIQDSEERKSRGEVPKVDFKLAVPIREKRMKVQKEKEKVEAANVPSEPELSTQLLAAVKSVAVDLDGDPETTENDLVQKLKTQQTEKINLSELFLGMKIDRTQKPSPIRSTESEGSRAQRVRQMLNEGDQQQQPHLHRRYPERPERRMPPSSGFSYAPIDLFGSRPLGIFSESKKSSPPAATPTLSTWDTIHQRELKLAATHPPANGFEEMILWTEQGKFWHFPIDNEQGNDENSKFDFTDHVFLEPVIESWCPKKGPIRHFMELVTVALSKNPYLTVPEKHEYLNWYHEYFKKKSHILKQVGAEEIH